MRIVRLTRTHPGPLPPGGKGQPACAECGMVKPLVLGLETDKGYKVPLCEGCTRDVATELLRELGFGLDAGRMLDLVRGRL